MNLLSLPGELLQLIIQDTKEDWPTLTLVCHELREKILPKMYKTICLNPFQGDRPHKYQPPAYLLARTFLENPGLADLVRQAHFLGWNTETCTFPGGGDYKEPDADTLKSMKDYIHQSELPYPDYWISVLELASVDAYAAIALSKMTRLRTLTLQVHELGNFFGLLLKGALSLGSPAKCISSFSELRNVKLGAPSDNPSTISMTRLDISHILPLFYLPAIESIEIHGISVESRFDWPGSKKPQCPFLKTLILNETTTNPRALAQILTVTPHLRTLEFSETIYVRRNFGEILENLIFDLSDLGHALSNVRKSLTKLNLGIEYFGSSYRLMNGPLGIIANRLGPLDTFEELEYLEISPVCLFGSSKQVSSANETLLHLPRSLKVLSLSFLDNMGKWGASKWLPMGCLERLGLLLRNKEKIVPNLECIIIRIWSMYDMVDLSLSIADWSPHERKMMEEMCRSASVECQIID